MYNIDDIVNTVIHGDSHIELKKIPNESIDCIIIDPPYRYLKHKLDRPFDEALIFNELYRVLKPNSFLVIFGIGARLCRDIVMLEDIGFKCKEDIVWDKNHTNSPFGNISRQHEFFYILSKGTPCFNKVYVDYFENCVNDNGLDKLYKYYLYIRDALKNNDKDILNYLQTGIKVFNKVYKDKHYLLKSKKVKNSSIAVNFVSTIVRGKQLTSVIRLSPEHWNYDHPTQKPLELMSRIVKLVSNENDIVLDCFAGSGSTLLGAIKNDRRYIGIEIDNEYYDVCINRIKEKQGLFYGKD